MSKRGRLSASDWAEIQNLYGYYNLCSDSGDAEGYASCFTEDRGLHLVTRDFIVRGRRDLVDYKRKDVQGRGDIIRRARVSRETFYLYFKNKDDIFQKAVTALVNELFAVSRAQSNETDLRARIAAGNRRYLESFARHRHLLRSMFQVATFDPRIAGLHRDIRTQSIRRIQLHLEKIQTRGLLNDVNVEVTATAVALMDEWFAYLWLATEEFPQKLPFDMDTVVDTLTEIWCRGFYQAKGSETALASSPR